MSKLRFWMVAGKQWVKGIAGEEEMETREPRIFIPHPRNELIVSTEEVEYNAEKP